ncbi:MAG: YbaK/EbsC family protein [Clostridia bacterium]|nr:YbaK/EbsC family protein [Clostridia bacterium]
MSIERVRPYLEGRGMADRIKEFDVSSATVELAAAALGCEGKRIAKTLSFMVNGKAILIVAAGDAKVDNSKYKAFFGIKAKMLTPDEAVELVGHAVGGVCPFAVNEGVKIYLDISLKRFETVYPAAGSSNSAVRLTPDELAALCPDAEWVDLCKAWQNEA